LFEAYVNSILSVISVAVSAFRSRRFFKILDSFYRFDKFTLQMHCPSNYKAQQFYLVFILFVWIYYIFIGIIFMKYTFFISLAWSLFILLTTIVIPQYIICIRMLSDRYKLANMLFENSKYLPKQTFKCNIN